MPTQREGVIDRIEDGTTAVIVLEDAANPRHLDVPIEYLPPGAHEAGTLVNVTVADGEFIEAEPRSEQPASRRAAIKEKFKSLSRRLSDGG